MEWWMLVVAALGLLLLLGAMSHALRFRGDPYRKPWPLNPSDIGFQSDTSASRAAGPWECALAVRWHNAAALLANEIIDEWRFHSRFDRDRVPCLRFEIHIFASFLAIWFMRAAGVTSTPSTISLEELLKPSDTPTAEVRDSSRQFITALMRAVDIHISQHMMLDGARWKYHANNDTAFLVKNYQLVASVTDLRIAAFYHCEQAAEALLSEVDELSVEERRSLKWRITIQLAHVEHVSQVRRVLGIPDGIPSRADNSALTTIAKQTHKWIALLCRVVDELPEGRRAECRHHDVAASMADTSNMPPSNSAQQPTSAPSDARG